MGLIRTGCAYPHGLEIILWSRRLQWPLVSVSLIACILLIALAISGRRRAWWLVGLAPVLALFAHRFALGPAAGRTNIAENPAFVSADQAKILDEDWIVGLTFGDDHFAYPYAALFSTPIVIQADHEKRMMLIWSAYANRAPRRFDRARPERPRPGYRLKPGQCTARLQLSPGTIHQWIDRPNDAPRKTRRLFGGPPDTNRQDAHGRTGGRLIPTRKCWHRMSRL